VVYSAGGTSGNFTRTLWLLPRCKMSTEINIDGPVSDGVSLPFEIVVQPTLTVFRSVAAPTPEKPPGSLLSTEEAAAFLAISAETLRRLCRRKAITFIQVASEYRFTKADLNEYVSSRRNRRKSVR
jgi:excisionase family DNA binding protein